MKKNIVLFFSFLSMIFYACSNNESGGTVVAPGESDPYIIDANLCTGITNNFPSGITNYFYPGERAYLWVHWANVSKGQTVTAEWWDPSNDKDSEYSTTFQSSSTKQISINYLDLGSFASTGEWQVKLYLDNSFMRSYRFVVGN
jgi:hypothetical protein